MILFYTFTHDISRFIVLIENPARRKASFIVIENPARRKASFIVIENPARRKPKKR